ncbi:MAG: VanZ family protein [Lachnospiraceae bacterium]|nr:VanZ family protein [Lachnospiraceae bacterium]
MSVISSYLGPVQSALLVFPVLALALTFPYIIFEYRHYGAIPILRTVIVYTFILYLINVYFQVILPLPDRDTVTAATATDLQLTPLNFLRQIRATTNFSFHNKSTWLPTLKNAYVYQAILNVALFFPLGVYLHYYFRRGFFGALVICFLGSLFCELTQLSGLYGYYPFPYRTFDVDDLLLNTCGGMLGWIFSPLICLILPSRERIDGAAYKRGETIPLFRRFLAFAVDFALISAVQWLISLVIPETAGGHAVELVLSIALTIAYFTVILTVTDGYTVGKALFRLRLSDDCGKSPLLSQYLIRYALLSLLVIHLPQYWILCREMMQITEGSVFYFWKNFQSLSQILAAVFIVELVYRAITHNRVFFYEKISRTKNESTVVNS